MVFLRYIFVLVVLQISSLSWAQINFHRVYAGNDYDFGYDLFQTEDTSYYLCGASSSLFDAPAQAILMKVDSLGNYQWVQSYGGVGSDAFLTIDKIPNKGFLLGGYSNENSSSGFENYLVEVDMDGNVVWDTIYGGSQWEKIVDVKVMEDSSFYVFSETGSAGSGGVDWWLQHFSKDHNLVWESLYGSSLDDKAARMLVYKDTLYLTGGIRDVVSGEIQGVLKKVSRDGVEIWDYNVSNHISGNTTIDALEVSHNSILITGGVYTNDVEETDLIVGGVNSITGQGTPYVTDFDGYQLGNAMALSPDSNFVYINVQSANSPQISNALDGSRDSFIFKYTYGFGFANFSFTYSKTFDDYTGNMIMTNDGGLALVGHQGFYSNGIESIYMVKMGGDESLPTPNQPTIDETLEVNELDVEMEVLIYPNPVDNVLIVKGWEGYDFEVVNSLGMRVEVPSLSKNIYDVSGLDKGVYYLVLKDNDYIRTLKFIKD